MNIINNPQPTPSPQVPSPHTLTSGTLTPHPHLRYPHPTPSPQVPSPHTLTSGTLTPHLRYPHHPTHTSPHTLTSHTHLLPKVIELEEGGASLHLRLHESGRGHFNIAVVKIMVSKADRDETMGVWM